MKQLSFKSIRTRIIFWFLILSMAPILLATGIFISKQVHIIESGTFDKLSAIRDLKVGRLNGWLSERAGDMNTIASEKELEDLVYIIQKDSYDQTDAGILSNSRRILNQYLNNYASYSELSILNPLSGKIMASTTQYMQGEDRSTEEYFTAPMQSQQLSINDIHFSNALSKYTMEYSIPIFSSEKADDMIAGILVARIDLNNSLFRLLLDRTGLGKTGETLIVNEDELVLSELRWHFNAPLNLKITAEPALRASQGKAGIVNATDYRGEEILAAYSFIPETGWGFVCKQDMRELRAPIRNMIWEFSILLLLSLIIIIIFAIYISRSITNPMLEMERVSRKLATGDFSEKLTIPSSDEIGSLARGYNSMMDAISSKINIRNGVVKISERMIEQSSIQDFGPALLRQLMDATGASMSTFYILNEVTGLFEHFASVGANEDLLKPFKAENLFGEFGNALSKKSIYYLRDIPENTIFKYLTTAGDAIPREIITIPIQVENAVIALISLVNIHKFSEDSFDIIKLSMNGLESAYSNLMASERTRVLSEHLSRINQQIETQAEELQQQSEELQQQTEELTEQNLLLESQRDKVETVNQLKSEFLSNMSHELRTPLNSILALSTVLRRSKSKMDDEEKNYLKIIERNGKQLLALINDILDLSKIEAGKMDVECKEVSLLSILAVIVESQEPIADKKGISVSLEAPEDLPLIETDELKLHHVLINIVGNAVKFTKEGKVEISVTHDSQNAYIRISDSGIGIPEESIETIFEEFKQVDGSSSREYGGTGLGLTIANKMIRVLGGSIQIESELEVGSVFTVILPLFCKKRIDNPELPNPRVSGKKDPANTDHSSETGSSRGKRILLVDDNEASVIQVKTILISEGFIVDLASGGNQALDYLKTTVPDGIILDLMMPETDGFEVLERIGNMEPQRHIPVMVLSAKDLQREDLRRLRDHHVHQILQKGDVSKDEMLSKVNVMLGINIKFRRAKPGKKKQVPKKAGKRFSISGLPGILVVEDNPDNMTVLNAILKDKYRVWNAINGEAGVAMARDRIPDLILLDMSLPGLDGLEVMQILKKNPETRDIPVIAVSASALKEDIESFLKAGCNDHISKPVDMDDLLGKIDELVTQ